MTLRSYIIGYILCVLLTVAAPALLWLHVYNHHRFPTHLELGIAFAIFALIQLAVQLIFFLHVGEKDNRSNLPSLFLALIVVCILVGGTLWIMQNLSANMQMDDSINQTYIGGTITPQAEND
ncbi:MAG TPA: cytochrome C oxidase subunit IV family protein [Candidatus Paceibacterota bacterium]|nr:cytochrome C oxidase subunit IV family protein [Candidatus Paceibacterota bacterium]